MFNLPAFHSPLRQLPQKLPLVAEALAYGDACWSRVMSHWRAYRDRGLTEHRNWWPDVYRDACRAWGVLPDDAALTFAETYEAVRADLQPIAGAE